jgi:diamine N-acetyltransferase
MDIDIPFIYKWENDERNWSVSETTSSYSLAEIRALVDSAMDYSDTRQKRWMIVLKESNSPIGTLDIFQGELPEGEAGIGILIADEEMRNKGFAKQAIEQAIALAQKEYEINTFHVLVHSNNKASVHLFKKCGFQNEDLDADNFNFEPETEFILKMSRCVKK